MRPLGRWSRRCLSPFRAGNRLSDQAPGRVHPQIYRPVAIRQRHRAHRPRHTSKCPSGIGSGAGISQGAAAPEHSHMPRDMAGSSSVWQPGPAMGTRTEQLKPRHRRRSRRLRIRPDAGHGAWSSPLGNTYAYEPIRSPLAVGVIAALRMPDCDYATRPGGMQRTAVALAGQRCSLREVRRRPGISGDVAVWRRCPALAGTVGTPVQAGGLTSAVLRIIAGGGVRPRSWRVWPE